MLRAVTVSCLQPHRAAQGKCIVSGISMASSAEELVWVAAGCRSRLL